MSQLSSSSAFQALFNTALQDYKHKTGSSLVDRPFAKQFQVFDSVESITTILEEQARIFGEFRDHGKLVISLKRLVDVLCSPFFTTVLEKGIDLVPFPPAKAVFAGISILLATAKDISTSYDALVDLFASFENFLNDRRKVDSVAGLALAQDHSGTLAQTFLIPRFPSHLATRLLAPLPTEDTPSFPSPT